MNCEQKQETDQSSEGWHKLVFSSSSFPSSSPPSLPFSLFLNWVNKTKGVDTSAIHMDSRALCLMSACLPTSLRIHWNTKAPWNVAMRLLEPFGRRSLPPSLAESCRAAQQSRACHCSLTFRSRPQIITSFSKLTRVPLFLRHISSYGLQMQAAEPNHQRD